MIETINEVRIKSKNIKSKIAQQFLSESRARCHCSFLLAHSHAETAGRTLFDCSHAHLRKLGWRIVWEPR